jgi:hypothetical protein
MARANNEGSVHKSKSDGRWVAAPSYRTETGGAGGAPPTTARGRGDLIPSTPTL